MNTLGETTEEKLRAFLAAAERLREKGEIEVVRWRQTLVREVARAYGLAESPGAVYAFDQTLVSLGKSLIDQVRVAYLGEDEAANVLVRRGSAHYRGGVRPIGAKQSDDEERLLKQSDDERSERIRRAYLEAILSVPFADRSLETIAKKLHVEPYVVESYMLMNPAIERAMRTAVITIA